MRFVELDETIPVQGPETEVEDRMVFADFMALLDQRERQIVVLLSSGPTTLTDIAAQLGYANHGPISKRLTKIRRKAETYLDLHQRQTGHRQPAPTRPADGVRSQRPGWTAASRSDSAQWWWS